MEAGEARSKKDRIAKFIRVAGCIYLLWAGGQLCLGVYHEIAYDYRVIPTGVTDLRGFVARYGEIDRACLINRGSTQYVEVMLSVGENPAIVSGPPAYVFERAGRLVEWSPDTGDNPSFVEKWPFNERRQISAEEFRKILEQSGSFSQASTKPK